MSLIIQIKSLVFSFIFGCLFNIFFRINYKYLYYEKIVVRIVISFLFSIDMAILYFIILKNINNGIIHAYFLLMIIFGFFLTNYFIKRKIK